MNRIGKLFQVADELERIEALMKATALGGDEGWKKIYIGLRRQLQERLFALHPESFDLVHLTKQQASELRIAYGDLRAAAATHQGVWPVVGIDGDDPDYRASVAEFRRASDLFLAMCRALKPA